MTLRQLDVLRFVATAIRARGMAPTLDEIELGLAISPATVHGHLAELERKRYLQRRKYKPRAITLIEPVP